jgi:hypothetical protein
MLVVRHPQADSYAIVAESIETIGWHDSLR